MDKWKEMNRLDRDGDPVFRAPDGSYFAVSAQLGTLQEMLDKLNCKGQPPWYMMEKVGHEKEWVLVVEPTSDKTDWEEELRQVAKLMKEQKEDIFYHDWEQGNQRLVRPRLEEERARDLEAALKGQKSLKIVVQPAIESLVEQIWK